MVICSGIIAEAYEWLLIHDRCQGVQASIELREDLIPRRDFV